MMADKQPNYRLEIRRLHWLISQQKTAREACFVQMWEAIDKIEQAKTNLSSHDKAIADYRGKLKSLEETHGGVTEQDTLSVALQIEQEGADNADNSEDTKS